MGILSAIAFGAIPAGFAEQQLTFSPKNHNLDNNDNFSGDGRLLCYDTREWSGPGIGNSQSIEMVDIETATETVLYAPGKTVTSMDEKQSAPGVGAASFCPVRNEVVFIHGPLLDEVPARGYYGKPNRRGAVVPADGSGLLGWLDQRDTATDRDTTRGAHRGGTHRHEYTMDGKRIGFTYDDALLPQYGRTIGYMEQHANAPEGATCYFAVLVPVVPIGTAKPGEIEVAAGDSWIGRHGYLRAFIGKVRDEDGIGYSESLFTVSVPAKVDITTADSGSATRYPTPPKGVSVRRLTHDWAGGVVRGAPGGGRIAYFGRDAAGMTQIFIIAADGSDRDKNPNKRPRQLTHFEKGAGAFMRWHPSGNSLLCLCDNGIVAVCAQPGPHFGKHTFLTPHGDGPARSNLVVSPDGRMVAYNKPASVCDESGYRIVNYKNEDCLQIFLVPFPDENGDGIADELTK